MNGRVKVEMHNLLHCAECHGPVETRDVLENEVSTMNSVAVCHRAARGASEKTIDPSGW